MASCTREYLSLCSVPKAVDRHGRTGAYASQWIPFVGQYFANGATLAPNSDVIPQDQSRTLRGVSLPSVFTKGFVKA